jgi:hypothetical protein
MVKVVRVVRREGCVQLGRTRVAPHNDDVCLDGDNYSPKIKILQKNKQKKTDLAALSAGSNPGHVTG